MDDHRRSPKKLHLLFLALWFLGLVWSGINPHDAFTWILEVFPAILGLVALAVTYRRFQFSDMTYVFILLHCYVLFVGGHYTYAEVPLFNWVRDTFHQSRNNYDKVGHFVQGFVPAMIARELFLRLEIVKRGAWMSFLTVTVCATISVLYELLEWFVAVISGASAEAFLGTQGDVWDTQSDMLMAIIGATVMVLLFSRLQDRQLRNAMRSAEPH
jgi:putative membrane protein